MTSLFDLIRVLKKESTQAEKTALRVNNSNKRAELAKKWNLNGLNSKDRARLKRTIDEVIRRGNKYSKRIPKNRDDLVLLNRWRRTSLILDSLYPSRLNNSIWQRLKNRIDRSTDTEISFENFSLIHNPIETLDGFARLAQAEATAPVAKINFTDAFCRDITAFMLLVEFWHDMLPIFEGGQMDVAVQKVLAAVGLSSELGIGLNGVEDLDDVWAFPKERRRKTGATKSGTRYLDIPTRDLATDRFCDALDAWLIELGYCLTDKGLGWIKGLLGEVLENAERHSDGERRDGAWSVSGFMARRQEEADGPWIFRAHVGIVSIGDTFSESLDRASVTVKAGVAEYLALMRRKGAVQSDATLRTLAALQDGVTCVREADEAGRGGYGLMEMLDLLNFLGGNEDHTCLPEVTIISGSSCIMMKYPYHKGVSRGAADSARVQWFNEGNSALETPEEASVFDLPYYIPGTAVCIAFTLDPVYLKQGVESRGKDVN